jgi:TPR repeat protein
VRLVLLVLLVARAAAAPPSALERELSKVAALEAGCARDNFADCGKLAARLHVGHAVAHDESRAERVGRRACDGGDATGCLVVAHLVQPPEAARLAERACELKSGEGCDLAAGYLRDGWDSKGITRARAIFRSRCDGGDGLACELFAGMAVNGNGGEQDFAAAHAAHQRGCDLGDSDACGGLAAMWADGQGVTADQAKAAAATRRMRGIHERRCRAGDAEYCGYSNQPVLDRFPCEIGYGDVCERLADVAVDDGRKLDGAALHDLGCRAGNAIACEHLGMATRDANRAAELFQRACDGGVARACARRGDQLRQAGDRAAAVRLYQQACDGKSGAGCAELARAVALIDTTASLALARRGCELGDGGACVDAAPQVAPDEAATLLKKGCAAQHGASCFALADVRIPRDDKVAKQLTRWACQYGHNRACLELAAAAHRTGDEKTARAFYFRACENHDAAGCAALTLLDKRPQFPSADAGCRAGDAASCSELGYAASDSAAARVYFVRACVALPPWGCDEAGRRSKAPAAAEALWRRGCAADDGAACSHLAFVLRGFESLRLEQRACELAFGWRCDPYPRQVP